MHKKYPVSHFIRRKHELPNLKKKIISDECEYWNIRIKLLFKYYLYLYSFYFWRTNIFGYLLGKYVASKYIPIFIQYLIWHPNMFGYLFVSILWYSLITYLPFTFYHVPLTPLDHPSSIFRNKFFCSSLKNTWMTMTFP